jgi:ATP-binding cassette subfamily F protein 3
MELVADRLWLVADGHVKPFDGDMDDYARRVLDRARMGPARRRRNERMTVSARKAGVAARRVARRA